MAGEIRRAVIRRLAEQHRIPIAAAAHKYACMSIARKMSLCDREDERQRRLASAAPSSPAQKD